ncbi:LOG family protein [Nonomuraea sp. NPDC050404]|uniref:LOG family protein n=1 Tax=Nonomuraea sp. NPDC050404 TaxID=3155783 RepID=UPI0034107E3F
MRTTQERKAIMAEKADAFLALPGGLGTPDGPQTRLRDKPSHPILFAVIKTSIFLSPSHVAAAMVPGRQQTRRPWRPMLLRA